MAYPKSSTGAAVELGTTRDSVLYMLRTAPELEPKMRFSGRRMFMKEDIDRIQEWMKSRKRHSVKCEVVGA